MMNPFSRLRCMDFSLAPAGHESAGRDRKVNRQNAQQSIDSAAGRAYVGFQRRFELPACGRFKNAAKAVTTRPGSSRDGVFVLGLVRPVADPRDLIGQLAPASPSAKAPRTY